MPYAGLGPLQIYVTAFLQKSGNREHKECSNQNPVILRAWVYMWFVSLARSIRVIL